MERNPLDDFFVFRQFCFQEPRRNDIRNGNDCHFIGFMRQGEGRLIFDGGEVRLSRGELFYIPRGVSYVSVWGGDGEVIFDSYGFSRFPLPAAGTYPIQRVEADTETLAALERLAAHRTVDLYAIGCLYILLDRMLPQMRSIGTDSAHRTVEAALAYLREVSDFSVAELARHCRVSESGLYAAFRRVKGCTPVNAWHRILVERAEVLLTSTDLSVEEISRRLNFCSASYFRKIVRSVTGCTPRELRARSRI